MKHRRDGDRGSPVGTPDLQRVNGTARQLYGADVVLVHGTHRTHQHHRPALPRARQHDREAAYAIMDEAFTVHVRFGTDYGIRVQVRYGFWLTPWWRYQVLLASP